MPAFDFDDAFIRERFEQVATEESLYKAALWNAGAIVNDASLGAMVGSGDGRLFTKKFYLDLGEPAQNELGTAPGGDVTNGPTYPDDSDVLVPTHTLGSAEYQVTKNGPVASWDLKSIQNRFNFMSDPIATVESLLSEYWAKYLDKYAVASLSGVIAENILNDGGDLVVDVSDAAVAPDVTNTIQPDTIIVAEDTAGDAANFRTIVMHSRVYNNLRVQNLIDFIPSSDGHVNFALYQGKVVVVSDQVEVDSAGTYPVYTTYILGDDVLRYGASLSNGTNDNIIGFEQYRDPRVGRGAGLDQIISRVQFALHPMGYTWLDVEVSGSVSAGTGANIYPNLVDMRSAANWNRAASDRKHIPFAAIKSNG